MFSAMWLAGQASAIKPTDIVIEQGSDGGYHLYVRKSEGIESILLTESTADPERTEPVYALRDLEYHEINGDEKRMLDGEFLDPTAGLYSLIDSTPEAYEPLGEAFHIYVPYVAVFGYTWSRSGEVQILDGTWLNIRAFPKPYADYAEGFIDNPFIMRMIQKPLEGPPEDNYMTETLVDYREIAEEGGGSALLATGEDDIVNKLREAIGSDREGSLDLVLALDTTESMRNDFPHLRESLVPYLESITNEFDSLRFGMVLYKDYAEQYVTKLIAFQADLSVAQRILDTTRPLGGRDIPEAVNEALYAGVHGFPWEATRRMIVLVGDAPAHPRPRGRVTREMVYDDAGETDVELHTIILPQ
jgi:hypothetical protein